MAELIPLVSAVVATVIGVGLAYFGYEIAQKILALAGAVGGFAAGVALGSIVVPAVTGSPQSPGLSFVLGIVGAGLGGALVPALSQLAFGLAGFVMTSISVLAFLSRGRIVDLILSAIPTDLAAANPVAIMNRIASAALFQDPNFDQALLLSVGIGVVGGAIALKFYDEFVAVATTAIGASMLGLAIPILLAVYRGGSATVASAEFSLLWFGVTFVTGVAFELMRHSDEMSLV